ncbi:MAG: ribbon-helix-helix protein, CopG family [Candidatus Aenigmarchaeota archaeon]|nr:ribbon-helix-helix protein, CopG family [Candidatus Aenigmarchaeota archaeon]
MVERVTITIRSDVLKKIDRMVKDNDARNRSHAIENLISKVLDDIDTALILGGGKVQKPMIPVHSKPVLEHQINMLKKNGIRNIIVSAGASIKEYFGSGKKYGINITYVLEKEPCGTSGALYLSKGLLKSTFAVLNVDTLMEPDIKEMLEFHRNNKSMVTMLLVTADKTDNAGVAVMRGNHVVSFVEKPSKSKSKLVNAGFYIFEPAVLKLAKRKGAIEDVIFPKLATNNKLCGFLHDKPVFDVGTPEGYGKAQKEWKDVY